MDPWHDYLALPIAPAVLVVQIAALFIQRTSTRWSLIASCVIVIAAMFFYVASLPVSASEGVNIGAGVLLFWLLCSVVLVVVALIVEVLRRVRAGEAGAARRDSPNEAESKRGDDGY